jgi:hypothetical protein
MKTINKTFIFESKEAFDKAVFKEYGKETHTIFNGVSKEFAETHPNYEENNQTNGFCWNCDDSVNCIGCDSCSNCVYCVNCESCDACVRCEKCKDTLFSVSCENLNNSLDCHFVQFFEFHEESIKFRMEKPVFCFKNKYWMDTCVVPTEEEYEFFIREGRKYFK